MEQAEAFLDSVYSQPSTSKLRVTLTYAQSLDCKIAGKDGQQIILSGDESMTMTHRMRRRHDAILVGIGTLLNDDPQLNCRRPFLEPIQNQPTPFVLDPHLRTPVSAKVIRNCQNDIGKPLHIICSSQNYASDKATALIEAGAKLIPINLENSSRIPWTLALKGIEELGLKSLMIEGGASVIGNLMAQPDLIDYLVVTVAPNLIGDAGVGLPITKPGNFQHIKTVVFAKDSVFAMRKP